MKPRILGLSRQHKNKKLAFGDQPLPCLPWRRKAGASPATLRAGLPRPCRGGEDPPGPGRGRGGRSDAAGRDSRGAGGQTGEKGRGYGPALRLQRVGLHLESEAGTGGTTDSHLGVGHPCPGRVRGAHQKLEVSGDIGERAGQERAWRQGHGAEGSEDRGPLACPLGARWGWEGVCSGTVAPCRDAGGQSGPPRAEARGIPVDRSCTSLEWATSWEDDGVAVRRMETQRRPRVHTQFRTRIPSRVVKAGFGRGTDFFFLVP